MKSKSCLIIIFLLICVDTISLYGVVKGSDTAVSIQDAFTFPASDNDNTMLGFGWFKNGFSLEDETTTCTFDSVYPVSGDINLNRGTLYLNQDLLLKNYTNLIELGTIVGNNHIIEMCSSINAIPQNTDAFKDSTIVLQGDISVNAPVLFSGKCTILGDDYKIVSFNDNGQLIIDSGSQLTFKNIQLNDINTSKIVLTDDSSSLILNDCTWIQNGDYHFTLGSIEFLNTVDMLGSYSFIYDSTQTSTIAQKSEWHIANNMTLLIGKKSDDSLAQPLAMIDTTSVLKIENSIFRVNSHGIQLTKGTIAAVRDLEVDVMGTSSMTGLILGDNTPAGDMIFDLYPGSSTRYTGGHVTYAITNGNGIKSSNDNTHLARSNPSVFWLAQSLALSNITLDLAALAVLNISPGKTLTYSNSIINIAQGAFILNGTRYNSYTTLLSGNQSIFLIKGSLPLYTLVSSTGNVIQGNGNVDGAIILQDANAALTWEINGMLENNITLNGGTLILESDLNCMSGIYPMGSGTVSLGINRVNLGSTDLTWAGNTYWDGSQGKLNLGAQVTLSNTWTFSGNCVVDGHTNTLDLSSGSIIVEKGSNLTFVNMTIKNLNGINIQCIDNAGSITFDNVILQLNNNYTVTNGSIIWKNSAVLKGEGSIFCYQSPVATTIQEHSSLMLDLGLTFSYDTGNPNGFNFTDRSSILDLNTNAQLHSTMQGLNLTKGIIQLKNNSFLSGEKWTSPDLSTTIDNGISLGDCANSANDCILNIGGGVQLTINSGSLNYKNVDTNSLMIQNNLSGLFIADNAALNVYQTMNMGNANTMMGNFATLARAPGAEFNGSVSTLGVASFPTLDPC